MTPGPFKRDERECGICGKHFLKAPNNIYQVSFAGQKYHCCSYKCYIVAKHAKQDYSSKEYRQLRQHI